MIQYATFRAVNKSGNSTRDARSMVIARRSRIWAAVGFFGWPGIDEVGGGGAVRSSAFSLRWTHAGMAGSISSLRLCSRFPFWKDSANVNHSNYAEQINSLSPSWTCCVYFESSGRRAFPFCSVPGTQMAHLAPANRPGRY